LSKYEGILNKISPVFYKFINYRLYFSNNYALALSYLDKFNFPFRIHYYSPEISTIKTPTYFLLMNKWGVKFLPSIGLYKIYRKGKSFDISYEEAIINLILNKFSSEKYYVPYFYENSQKQKTFKDLFIALVGKDMYDTVRENIK